MAPLDLEGVPLVDHHAHAILRGHPSSLDEFRGLFSESPDPRQWPHVATGVTYRRAIGELAGLFGVEATEEAVYRHRLATEPQDYARLLVEATNTELLLLDDGYPPDGPAFRPGRCCASRPTRSRTPRPRGSAAMRP
jgi:hypothetical protein